MLIASLQNSTPDFYGGLTPVAAEITKDFFVGAHIYPEEYHGYCHLQCFSSFYLLGSHFSFHGMLFPIGSSYFQIWETLFMVVTWCHALIFVSKQADSALNQILLNAQDVEPYTTPTFSITSIAWEIGEIVENIVLFCNWKASLGVSAFLTMVLLPHFFFCPQL